VGKVEGSERGNFWLMTTTAWNEASTWTRIYYRFARSVWVILFAYVFVFAFSITLLPLIRDPKRHWDSAVSLFLHGGAITGLWLWQGAGAALLTIIVPMTISTMIGAYFFYAQHTYIGMDVLPDDEWTVARAAVASCSYLELGRIMKWISGDIGYHHVHHLNAAIPFYRLADAKRAIPELKDPIITTLRPRDILRCLRLKLWDPQRRELVPFPRRHVDIGQ
jgi:omega-6 fatty acid desaturase (delta-12 desaturase)